MSGVWYQSNLVEDNIYLSPIIDLTKFVLVLCIFSVISLMLCLSLPLDTTESPHLQKPCYNSLSLSVMLVLALLLHVLGTSLSFVLSAQQSNGKLISTKSKFGFDLTYVIEKLSHSDHSWIGLSCYMSSIY